jgi:hypothetical protein
MAPRVRLERAGHYGTASLAAGRPGDLTDAAQELIESAPAGAAPVTAHVEGPTDRSATRASTRWVLAASGARSAGRHHPVRRLADGGHFLVTSSLATNVHRVGDTPGRVPGVESW